MSVDDYALHKKTLWQARRIAKTKLTNLRIQQENGIAQELGFRLPPTRAASMLMRASMIREPESQAREIKRINEVLPPGPADALLAAHAKRPSAGQKSTVT